MSEQRQQVFKQLRLWLLSLVCATIGALTVWQTNRLLPGVLAFVASVAVFGTVLYSYERRRR